jgi:hypothetical protein
LLLDNGVIGATYSDSVTYSDWFKGKMSSFWIWNRVLSDYEISVLVFDSNCTITSGAWAQYFFFFFFFFKLI